MNEPARKPALLELELEIGDLLHDAAMISERDHSDMETAKDGAAISAGFEDWAEAERLLASGPVD